MANGHVTPMLFITFAKPVNVGTLEVESDYWGRFYNGHCSRSFMTHSGKRVLAAAKNHRESL
jgi:hypothetical protein